MNGWIDGWVDAHECLHASCNSLVKLPSSRVRVPSPEPRPGRPHLSAPLRPAAPFPVAPPRAGPDSSRTSSDSAVAAGWRAGAPAGQGRSRAGVGETAGTLGGGASGTAMGVEIETISPGDGTGWRSRGRRRGLGAEPGGRGSDSEVARRVLNRESWPRMGEAGEDPRWDCWMSSTHPSPSPYAPAHLEERRRRLGGWGLRPATAPGASGCRCPRLEPLDYPLLLIS